MSRQRLGGRYRLQKVLGRGGAATVWRAQDLRLERAVAVKLLEPGVLHEPGERERLGREARTLAQLAHPNIVAVHDFDVDTEAAYLVMELVDGQSLAALLDAGPLPVERAVAIAVQVCDALAAAHAVGVLHRDIKPANLLVTPDGAVKVCDFGIAQSLAAPAVTDPRTVTGTSEYLAPERASGHPSDVRADLYALGCVMYAMLTGAPPFTNRNQVRVLYQHLHQRPRPLADFRDDVPARLDELVLDLLAKHPAHRPASAHAVRARLMTVGTEPDPAPAGTDREFAPGTVAAPITDPQEEPTQPLLPAHHGRVRAWRPALVAGVLGLLLPVLLTAVFTARTGHGTAPHAGRSPAPVLASPAGVLPVPVPGTRSLGAAMNGSAPPGAATTGAAPTTAAPEQAGTPAQQIAALQAAIGQEAGTGQLDRGAANQLDNSLNDVIRRLGKGQTAKAVSRVSQLRQQLTVLVQAQRVTAGGYQVLAAGFDRLAGALGVLAQN